MASMKISLGPDPTDSMIQISLRDLFWLTVCAALVAAWWADHRRMDAHVRPWREWELEGRKGTPPTTITKK